MAQVFSFSISTSKFSLISSGLFIPETISVLNWYSYVFSLPMNSFSTPFFKKDRSYLGLSEEGVWATQESIHCNVKVSFLFKHTEPCHQEYSEQRYEILRVAKTLQSTVHCIYKCGFSGHFRHLIVHSRFLSFLSSWVAPHSLRLMLEHTSKHPGDPQTVTSGFNV